MQHFPPIKLPTESRIDQIILIVRALNTCKYLQHVHRPG